MDITERLRSPVRYGKETQGQAKARHFKERHEAAAEIERLRKSLARCLAEAEGWLDEARGCKPEDVMDYDGWADEARRLATPNGGGHRRSAAGAESV